MDSKGDSENRSIPPQVVNFATRIYDAARQGQSDLLEQALPAGLSPNLTNDKGDSLIMLASYHGHPSIVSLLLSYGGDPNSLNDRGQSPLAGAVFKKENAVIKALIEGGADPDLGTPSAMEAVNIFHLKDEWESVFVKAREKLLDVRRTAEKK